MPVDFREDRAVQDVELHDRNAAARRPWPRESKDRPESEREMCCRDVLLWKTSMYRTRVCDHITFRILLTNDIYGIIRDLNLRRKTLMDLDDSSIISVMMVSGAERKLPRFRTTSCPLRIGVSASIRPYVTPIINTSALNAHCSLTVNSRWIRQLHSAVLRTFTYTLCGYI